MGRTRISFFLFFFIVFSTLCFSESAPSGWLHSKGAGYGNYYSLEGNEHLAELAAYQLLETFEDENVNAVRTAHLFDQVGLQVISKTVNSEITVRDMYGALIHKFTPLASPELNGISDLSLNACFEVEDVDNNGRAEIYLNVSQNTAGGKNYLLICTQEAVQVLELPNGEYADCRIVKYMALSEKRILVSVVDRRSDTSNNGVYMYQFGQSVAEKNVLFGDGMEIDGFGPGKDGMEYLALHSMKSQMGFNPASGVSDDKVSIVFLNSELSMQSIELAEATSGFCFWGKVFEDGNHEIVVVQQGGSGSGFHFIDFSWQLDSRVYSFSESAEINLYAADIGKYPDHSGALVYYNSDQGLVSVDTAMYQINKEIPLDQPGQFSVARITRPFDEASQFLIPVNNELHLYDKQLALIDKLSGLPNAFERCIVSDLDFDGFVEIIAVTDQEKVEVYKHMKRFAPPWVLLGSRQSDRFGAMLYELSWDRGFQGELIKAGMAMHSCVTVNSWGTQYGYANAGRFILHSLYENFPEIINISSPITAGCFHPASNQKLYLATYNGSEGKIWAYDVPSKNASILKAGLPKIEELEFSTDGSYFSYIYEQDSNRYLRNLSFSSSSSYDMNDGAESILQFQWKGYEVFFLSQGTDSKKRIYSDNYEGYSRQLRHETDLNVISFAVIPNMGRMALLILDGDNTRIAIHDINSDTMKLEEYPVEEYPVADELDRITLALNRHYPVLTSVIYYDVNGDSSINQDDKLKLIFNMDLQVLSPFDADNDLRGTGGSSYLGSNSILAQHPFRANELILNLGESPQLNIEGFYHPGDYMTDAPGGLQISALLINRLVDSKTGIYPPLCIRDYNEGSIGVDLTYAFRTVSKTLDQLDSVQEIRIESDSENYLRQGGIRFPANSLSVPQAFSISPLPPELGHSSGFQVFGDLFDFDATRAPILELPFADGDLLLEEGFLPGGLRIHVYNETNSSWELYPFASLYEVDLENRIVRIDLRPGSGGKMNKKGSATVFANIGLPTVEDARNTGDFTSSSKTGVGDPFVLNAGSNAIYTKHQVTLSDYEFAASGLDVEIKQATAAEKHGLSTNAICKITASAEPQGSKIIRMEYKDDNDLIFTSDCGSSLESSMRIVRYNQTTAAWEVIPGTQTVDTSENTVTVTIPDSLSSYQLYGVEPYVNSSTHWRLYF